LQIYKIKMNLRKSYDKAAKDNELWAKIDYEIVKDPKLLKWIEQQEKLR